jgi:hypothetical protein
MIAKGVWGRWVSRMKEVDGLVGGRVVGFRVQVCWRIIKIKGEA